MPTGGALDIGTKLAIDRTFLAHERTMMAWVRTAASMISFGFTIYKFFQLELGNQRPPVESWFGPREFALVLIILGIGSLGLAFLEHRQNMRAMRSMYGDVVAKSTAGLVAGIVAVLGSLACVAVVFRQ